MHWGDGNTDTYASNGAKSHTYADGPATRTITVDLIDEDGTFLNRANAFSVTVDNVAPSIGISGAANVNEGAPYSLTLGSVTDPGSDTVSSYIVHWGDGNTDTYASNGAKSHTYADGPATRAITVDLIDEDGTFLNRANAFSVTVDNVAPSVPMLFAPADGLETNDGTPTFDWSDSTDPAGANDTINYVLQADNSGCDFLSAEVKRDEPERIHVHSGDGPPRRAVLLEGEGQGRGWRLQRLHRHALRPDRPHGTGSGDHVPGQWRRLQRDQLERRLLHRGWRLLRHRVRSGRHRQRRQQHEGEHAARGHGPLLERHQLHQFSEMLFPVGSTAWSMAFAYANFPSTGQYTVHAVTTDDAGNVGNASSNFQLNRYTLDYLSPLDDSIAPTVVKNTGKNGRVVPVKVDVFLEGVKQTSAQIPAGDLTIKVFLMPTCSADVTDAVEMYADAGNSNGNTDDFRASGDSWIYNLDTKALGLVTNSCYRLDVYLAGVKISTQRFAVFQPTK